MQYNVAIKGTNSLLLHKYTTASVSDPKTRINRGNDSVNYADEWVRGTYLNSKDEVVMPQTNLFACLFSGSKGLKKGKAFITRILYTAIVILDFEPLITIDGSPITLQMIKDNDWLHTSGAVISGRRIDRTRTCIPAGWEVNFSIADRPESVLSENDLRMIIENSGIYSGLGDWRPSSPKKPGPYGTFSLEKFEVIK